MLHILSSSPWKCHTDDLFQMLHRGDDLLLVQDGVFASVSGNCFVEKFFKIPIAIFALIDDIEARGLVGKVTSKITIINYTDFVNLLIKQPTQMNW